MGNKAEHCAEVVLDAKAVLGEGAIWYGNVLYWIDIETGKVCIFNPEEGTNREISVGQKVGTVVPRQKGGVAVALEHGFALLNLETEELTMLSDPEADLPQNRFNDGKCDPAGRFWAGTLSMGKERNSASLYVMETDHSVRKALGNVSTSNGIVWTSDQKTMYYIDTPTSEVWAFDYDIETGHITNQRTVITVPEEQGHPDGMTIDTNDNLWIALWGGSSVSHWDPRTGSRINIYPVPASKVTSCAFGGTNLDELYLTTARIGLSREELDREPHAGGIFCIKPGARGVPALTFGG